MTESFLMKACSNTIFTSRSQLDRILDPDNDKVQLDTVFKAARALGREVKLELV